MGNTTTDLIVLFSIPTHLLLNMKTAHKFRLVYSYDKRRRLFDSVTSINDRANGMKRKDREALTRIFKSMIYTRSITLLCSTKKITHHQP